MRGRADDQIRVLKIEGVKIRQFHKHSRTQTLADDAETEYIGKNSLAYIQIMHSLLVGQGDSGGVVWVAVPCIAGMQQCSLCPLGRRSTHKETP